MVMSRFIMFVLSTYFKYLAQKFVSNVITLSSLGILYSITYRIFQLYYYSRLQSSITERKAEKKCFFKCSPCTLCIAITLDNHIKVFINKWVNASAFYNNFVCNTIKSDRFLSGNCTTERTIIVLCNRIEIVCISIIVIGLALIP